MENIGVRVFIALVFAEALSKVIEKTLSARLKSFTTFSIASAMFGPLCATSINSNPMTLFCRC